MGEAGSRRVRALRRGTSLAWEVWRPPRAKTATPRSLAPVLYIPSLARAAVQTVWAGSVQSRPPVFLDCMKTVRPVRGFSGWC